MWKNKLKEIIYILENSNVNEIEVNFWGRKYRVSKQPTVVSKSIPSQIDEELVEGGVKILVNNRCDSNKAPAVIIHDGIEMAKKIGAEFVEVSAKNH